ncbi:MAG: hypothetical protein SVR94_01640 [Pseudomonadota bacterium]|nr:hypothetical protein [Pseudomonadota bacterium]
MELCRREQQLSIKVWSRFTDDSNRNNYVMTHTLEPENTPIQFDVFPECPPPKGGECVIPSYSMDSGIFDVPLVNVKVFGEIFPYAVADLFLSFICLSHKI